MGALDRITSGPLQSARSGPTKGASRTPTATQLSRETGPSFEPRALPNEGEALTEEANETAASEGVLESAASAARVSPRQAPQPAHDNEGSTEASGAPENEARVAPRDPSVAPSRTERDAPRAARPLPRDDEQQRVSDDRARAPRQELRGAARPPASPADGRLYAAPVAPREAPKVEAKLVATAAPLTVREHTVRVLERVERSVVERVASPMVAAPTTLLAPAKAARKSSDDESFGAPKRSQGATARPADDERERADHAQKRQVDRPASDGRESYAARLQRAEEELRERRLTTGAQGSEREPSSRLEAPSKGPAQTPPAAPVKALAEPRVRDKAAPTKAREPEGLRPKPAPTAKASPQPSLTPRAERRPAPSAAPKPAAPSIKISIGRVEIQTKGAPHAAEPSVVWPRAHGIDPGLPFGSSIPGRF